MRSRFKLHPVEVHSSEQLDAAMATIAQQAQAALVIANPLASANAKGMARSAVRNRLPTMHEFRFYALAGGYIVVRQ